MVCLKLRQLGLQPDGGWEGDRGDDSLLCQATDIVEDIGDVSSDRDMFSDDEKKFIPDTLSDEEVK